MRAGAQAPLTTRSCCFLAGLPVAWGVVFADLENYFVFRRIFAKHPNILGGLLDDPFGRRRERSVGVVAYSPSKQASASGGCGILRKSGVVLWLVLLLCGCGARTTLDVPLDGECVREPVSMQVPSTTPWFDTGIDVTAGQRLHITATGTVRYGGKAEQVIDADGGNYTGKKFFMAAVLPTTMVCSLIGKVGGTTALGTGTPLLEGTPSDGPGFVGTSYDEIVPESGRLFLGFNDQKEAFGDNSGEFTVTITLIC